jgi:hypothetical protein
MTTVTRVGIPPLRPALVLAQVSGSAIARVSTEMGHGGASGHPVSHELGQHTHAASDAARAIDDPSSCPKDTKKAAVNQSPQESLNSVCQGDRR